MLVASIPDLEQFITHTQAGQPGRASPRRGRHSENSVVTKLPWYGYRRLSGRCLRPSTAWRMQHRVRRIG